MCVQSTTVCDVGLLTHLRLYTLTCRYIRMFTESLLQVAAPGGRVFPSVGTGAWPSPMTPSLVINKAIKRVWASFVRIDKRPDNPPASALTSSYLRNVFVLAVNYCMPV